MQIIDKLIKINNELKEAESEFCELIERVESNDIYICFHPHYLSEELISISIFDAVDDYSIKKEIQKKLKNGYILILDIKLEDESLMEEAKRVAKEIEELIECE